MSFTVTFTVPDGLDEKARQAYALGFLAAEERARKLASQKNASTKQAMDEPAKPAEPVKPKTEPVKQVRPAEPVKPKTSFATLASEMPSNAAQHGKVVEVKASEPIGPYLNSATFDAAKKVEVSASEIKQIIDNHGGLNNFLLATTDLVPGHTFYNTSKHGFWAKGTVIVRASDGTLVLLKSTKNNSSYLKAPTKYVPKGLDFKLSESLTDPSFFIGLTEFPNQPGSDSPFVWGLNRQGYPFGWKTARFSWEVEKDDKKYTKERTYYIMPTSDSKSAAEQRLSKYAVYIDGDNWRVVQWDQKRKMYVGCTVGAVYNAMYNDHSDEIRAKLNPRLSAEALAIITPKIFNAYEKGLQDAQKAFSSFKPGEAGKSDEEDVQSELSDGWQPAK